jgi:hypothetical protein
MQCELDLKPTQTTHTHFKMCVSVNVNVNVNAAPSLFMAVSQLSVCMCFI